MRIDPLLYFAVSSLMGTAAKNDLANHFWLGWIELILSVVLLVMGFVGLFSKSDH